jgi:hypothetical protein
MTLGRRQISATNPSRLGQFRVIVKTTCDREDKTAEARGGA